MRDELKRLQRELGMTFIHVTHAQDEAMALADLVVLMNEGRIEQQGSPREVFHRPRTAFVARFLGVHNVIAVVTSRLPCEQIGCAWSYRIRRRSAIGTARRTPPPLARPDPDGHVRDVEYQGTVVQSTLTTADGTELVAVAPEQASIASRSGPAPS